MNNITKYLGMKKRFVSTLLVYMAVAASVSATTIQPRWLRDVKISPDGQSVAFTYQGDIWTVPVAGGEARQVTTAADYDYAPVWSPDSRSIAFASDRQGGADVFIVDAHGGKARRLTFNSAAEVPTAFTPDGKNVVYVAAIQDVATSNAFPTSRLTELYSVPVDGGRPEMIISTPAEDIAFLPDGRSFLYMDQKGMENIWRKHHTSSVTRDIWRYDPATGRHTNLTDRPGEDRNPVISPDGSTVTILSERNGGDFNLWSFPLDNPANARQLTQFKGHPVRFLSQANDATLAFAWDGDIYTMRPDGKPRKLDVTLTTDPVERNRRIRFTSGADEVAISPDGKQAALIERGDVVVVALDHSSSKQITNTPAAEASVTWSASGDTLFYTSERDGVSAIWMATRAHESDPNFSNATVINEKPLMKKDNVDRRNIKVSPDGKKLLFLEDRNRIRVMDLKSGKVTKVTEGANYPQRDADFNMVWSPDSRWIATEYMGNRHEPYADIAIINVETGETINLTNSGYFDMNPRWVMDGNAIIFISDRYGMRNHASWGSQEDVMIAFLNQEAYDRFALSEEDYELRKEAEKSRKKKEKESEKSDKKDKEDKKDAPEEKVIKIDRDNIDKRIMRLTPFSSSISDAVILGEDNETLYFMSRFDDGYDLWKASIGKDSPEFAMVKKLGDSYSKFDTTRDGKSTFLISRSLRKLNPNSGALTPVTYQASITYDPVAERDAMLSFVKNEEGERFYRKDMHGVKWNDLVEHYRQFLPHINNDRDYSILLSELLGELNVSHTGSGYRGSAPAIDRTASLGLFYDPAFKGNGLKVVEVIEGGPFDLAETAMKPGAVISSINDQPLSADSDPMLLLANTAGKKALIEFSTPSGEKVKEVIIPITRSAEGELLYERWVKGREAYVDSISGGRLGYVHLESMSDDSFRKAYGKALGKFNTRDGIVIDTRWNGGGRLHEDIEVLFSGNKYFTQVVRGVESCDMPSRRWNKPSVMVTCEANYSNAHGTPWVYQHQGLGKVVGAPVPGTMTSVNWVTLQNPALYFGIPVVGYRLPDGSYLENTQLEPDVTVLNDPYDVVRGRDAQLDAAVKVLLEQKK